MIEEPGKNESAYCDYNSVFVDYDRLRRPNGIDELLDIFSKIGPVDKLTVLEGGFGTGAYLNILRKHVKAIYGVEGSEQGLAATRKKAGHAGNVHLNRGNILDLSFPDNFFDGYMVNQVLHHLDTDPAFPNLTRFLKEAKRVLKSGGSLVINTCSQAHLDPFDGVYWSYAYMASAAHRIAAKYAPIETLVERLMDLGFTDIRQTIPSGRLFEDRYYSDPSLVLEPEFQNGDSIFCICSPEEIRTTCERIKTAISDQSVYRRMELSKRKAAEIGEAVMVSARISA